MSARRRQVDAIRMVQALEAENGGISPEESAQALAQGIRAIRLQLEALAGRRYDPKESRAWRVRCVAFMKELLQLITTQQTALLAGRAEDIRRLIRLEPMIVDAVDVGRTLGQTASAVDTLYRLVEFAQGREDSRPGRSEDWLKRLSPEQFEQVRGWLGES